MTISGQDPTPRPPQDQSPPRPTPEHDHESPARQPSPGGHGLMMLVCCIPMLAIAVLLVVTGVASSGILLVALGCTAMMAMMMWSMPGGHGHK